MKLDKDFVVCPNCKKANEPYILTFEKLTNVNDEIVEISGVSVANFCTYCGYDFRKEMHKRCEECGFIDWSDVFTDKCPFCEMSKKTAEENKKIREEKNVL
jgi:uncharacterized Zn-finger protein